MAELDEPGDEPNFDLFGSFGLDFFSDDELLLTETDLTEQTEQTEIGQLNDEDIDNFITENRNKNTTKKTQSDLNGTRNSLQIPLYKTAIGQRTFSYRGAYIWNNLHNELRQSASLASFKRALKDTLLRQTFPS